MGRRAKNKQGDPQPFAQVQENAERPSQKKLGKRKAEEVDAPTKRPAKKAKDAEGRPAKPIKPAASKGKDKIAVKGDAKAKASAAQGKKKRVEFDDEDEGAGSSEGWEDVEDDGDLKAHAKYVTYSRITRRGLNVPGFI